jgi:peptide/nickel transport system substrate-binding protein
VRLTRRHLTASALAAGAIPRWARAADKPGGVINVATIGEPPTLDPMISTADLVGTITQHFFEPLYTFDRDWKVTPLLAAALPEVSADGTQYTIHLRRDVKFHDGAPMTVADVLASLQRWTSIATRGRQTAANISGIDRVDDATIRIALKQPYAPLASLLAFNNSAAVIMPAGQANPITEIVGTGPYRLKEHKADQYIQLVRNEYYVPLAGEGNFYGGARRPLLDEIRFVPVPDPDTRVAGAVSGQFDYVDNLSVESYDRIAASKVSAPVVLSPYGWPVLAMNTKQGALTDVALRRAIQVALNPDDMMAAAFGKQFYAAEGAMYPKGFVWHTDAGVVRYGEGDPDKAAKMVKAAGHDAPKIRLLTTHQYEFHYKIAQVAAEYLKQAGFVVDLQVTDWATLTTRRTDPALWEIYVTSSPFLPEPALNGYMLDDSPGWWATPRKQHAVSAFNRETDPDKRIKLFADIQAAIFDEAPIFKVGNFSSLSARSATLQGLVPAPWPFFWNVTRAA